MEEIKKELMESLDKLKNVIETLKKLLVEEFQLEKSYNDILNPQLDFNVREALEKQKIKIELNNPELKKLNENLENVKIKIKMLNYDKEFLTLKINTLNFLINKN